MHSKLHKKENLKQGRKETVKTNKRKEMKKLIEIKIETEVNSCWTLALIKNEL